MTPVKITAQVIEFDKPNLNRRIYPSSLAKSILAFYNSLPPSGRCMVGMLDNPADSSIHFAEVSHVVTKLWVEQSDFGGNKPVGLLPGSKLMCEIETLDTPCGKVLRKLLTEHPESVAFRPMGVGSGQVNQDGFLVIGDSYKFITINAVAAHEAS